MRWWILMFMWVIILWIFLRNMLRMVSIFRVVYLCVYLYVILGFLLVLWKVGRYGCLVYLGYFRVVEIWWLMYRVYWVIDDVNWEVGGIFVFDLVWVILVFSLDRLLSCWYVFFFVFFFLNIFGNIFCD